MHKLTNKSKLSLALKLNKKPLDPKLEHDKFIKNRKNFNEKPVTGTSAERLVSQILSKPITDKVGPLFHLTELELNKVFEQKNLRLNYKILGTSGSQLQDSMIVDKDVSKFLERDDLNKAIKLMEMARFQGAFALGTIVRYLIKKGKINESFELISKFKKRGLPLNGRVLNIMISDYADAISSKSIDKSDVKIIKLMKLVQNEINRGNPDISKIHVNSLMKLFRRSKHPELSYHFYFFIKEKKIIKPDVITYTELFRNISNIIPNEELPFIEILNQTERAFFTVQHELRIKIDDSMMYAYVNIFAYSNDPLLQARAITIIREWWRLCSLDDIKQKINYSNVTVDSGPKVLTPEDRPKLLSSDLINAKKTLRFMPNEKVLALYEQLCSKFNVPHVYKPK